MKAHRRCLYSKYCKYLSVKEPQTSQPRLMWNLQSPWDIANISCGFSPSPDSIHMLTTDVCKAFSPKKESFFSCPVFVLHKIWGLAALKKTKPKPNQEGSAEAAERQLVGSDAHACKSAAAVHVGPQRGLPATKSQQPQKACTDRKIRMNEGGREGGRTSRSQSKRGVCRNHSKPNLGDR